MSLRWFDGMESWDSAQDEIRYDVGSAVQSSNSHSGRFGGKSKGLSKITKSFDNQETWIVGVALITTVFTTSPGTFLKIYDGATLQCYVNVSTLGIISIKHGGTDAILGDTGSWRFKPYVWHYIEVKVTIGNSGAFELKVDGKVRIAAGSGDTQNSVNAYANKITLYSISGESIDIDDYYICDGATDPPWDDFLGEVKVVTKFPNAISSIPLTDFTSSTGITGSNYLQVDEHPHDSDTTYNYSSVTGACDMFNFNTFGLSTVYGVQINDVARKDDVALRETRNVIYTGATGPFYGEIQTLTATYVANVDMFQLDPRTSVQWDPTELDNSEFGYEVYT